MAADDVTTLDHTLSDLADGAVALATRWVHEGAKVPADPAAERLAGVLKDPNGLDFTIGFVDRVVRPHDLHVAGRNLRAVAKMTPRFLPWYMRFAVRLGGAIAPALPWAVVPIARRVPISQRRSRTSNHCSARIPIAAIVSRAPDMTI